jgi:hypothetical protein
MPLHLSPVELAEAGDELARQAESAMAAVQDALRNGRCTAADRAKLEKIGAAMAAQAADMAAKRAEAEAASQAKVAAAGHEIARASADRLRFRLAALAPPRSPATGKRRS